MLSILATAVYYAIDIYCLLIVISAVLSFFPRMDTRHPVVRTLDQLTSPVLTPFRRMLPPMGGMDFSPLIALFTLRIVQQLIVALLNGLQGG